MKPSPAMPAVSEADVVWAALVAGRSVPTAAGLLGMAVPAFYQRARRAGVRVRTLMREIRRADALAVVTGIKPRAPVPPPGDAILEGHQVRLSLADYAILKWAAESRDTEIAALKRTIATLTRELTAAHAAQQ